MISSILPLALYLVFGYLFKLFVKDYSKQLVDFVIFFALPAMVFTKFYPIGFSFEILQLIFLFNIIIIANIAISFIVGFFLKLDKKKLATFVLVASFGNTSFVGLSYISAFYGNEYLNYVIIYDLFGSFILLVTLGAVIISYGSGERIDIKNILKKIILFPPIIFFILTLILQNFQLPLFVFSAVETLSLTLVPVAMITIGMKLELKEAFYELKTVLTALFIKMLFVPSVVLVAFYIFYNIEDTWIKVTIVEAAMPPMTTAVVLAIKANLDKKLAINSLVFGVLLSFLTITVFHYFLENFS